jgi:hypothetical protein
VILEAAVAGALVVLGWRLVSLAAFWVDRLAEPEDGLSTPTGAEREARRRRASWRALVPFAAPWLCWGPMLLWVERPAILVLLLAAGFVVSLLGSLHATQWRFASGLLLALPQGIVQVALLLYLAGLAAESRLDPQAEAQRATVVELRKLGRAWWDWSQSARPPADAPRETDAALLLADRAVGWPALRGLDGGGPRLVHALEYPQIDSRELARLLFPGDASGESRLALVDGWGRQLEIRGWLEPRDSTLPRFLVRSAGADGRFDDLYRAGPFPAERVGEDIVWADGAFLREPEPALAPN